MKQTRKSLIRYGAYVVLLLYLTGAAATLGNFAGKVEPRADSDSAQAQASSDSEQPLSTDGLPKVLSSSDAELYRSIFIYQSNGDWVRADRLIEELEDRRLLGHVLAQRHLHPEGPRSAYGDLADWLVRYADQPDAQLIYRLALKKRPKGAKRPQRPRSNPDSLASRVPGASDAGYQSKKRLSAAQQRRVRKLRAQIERNLRTTKLTATEKLLASAEVKRLFDRVQMDEASAGVAAGWLYLGDYEKAYRLAAAAALRSGLEVPLAHWTSGLAAWQLGRIAVASAHFEALGRAQGISPWVASAGSYWAARAQERLGMSSMMVHRLLEAGRHPRTFYGMLAQQRLGMTAELDFNARRLRYAQAAPLLETARGARALALLQVGERHRAEQELMGLEDWRGPKRFIALLAVADFARLPALSLRLSTRLLENPAEGWSIRQLDTWQYPLPPWEPQGGFIVDRALIYAVMRQESGFDPHAVSPDDARGLMQLMPITAGTVAQGRRFRGRQRSALFEPALNIELGQRYLKELLDLPLVRGDLFRLVAAYNAGPGNLSRWQRQMDFADDPLLFIELLPALETRLFIERVLTNLWTYRKRLGQAAPSLEALAEDRWPRYQALDDAVTRAAPGTAAAERRSPDAAGRPPR